MGFTDLEGLFLVEKKRFDVYSILNSIWRKNELEDYFPTSVNLTVVTWGSIALFWSLPVNLHNPPG